MKILLILTIFLGLYGAKISTDESLAFRSTACLWGSILGNVLGMLFLLAATFL
jgi:hypothetical protein